MTVSLNEDIFTLIYSYTFDFEVLRTTATAIATNKQHPLHRVVLRRLLQLPLRLSSENLRDSKALIDHFVHNSTHVGLIRDIVIVLGPSRKSIAEHERFREIIRYEDRERAERAEDLVELLPELLRRTEYLQRLDWFKYPPPNREILKALSKRSLINHLSLDCSVEPHLWPDPPEPPGEDTRNSIKPLLSTVGSKVRSFNLRNVDENVFNTIEEYLPPLKNIRTLRLDLACAVWDWEGAGSPQPGPSEHYRFPRISSHIQELELLVTDFLTQKQKGPIELVDSKKLTKLKIEVIHCFGWVCIDFVHLFSGFTAADFSSLTHLIIDDYIRDMRRWAVGDRIKGGDWQESGRTYVGIHELISGLPQLRHLWVNERVLAVPSFDNRDDAWTGKPFDRESQETIMSRTISSPQWEHLKCTFERLESLRVGFGPLNATWVTKILSHCDHTKLRAFGFDWEWQPGSTNPGIFSELIATLSKLESLTDLHILHPYATLPTPIDYSNIPILRLAVRRVHGSEETEALVKGLLSELPGVYRVGIGRNSVWERRARWRGDDTDESPVQRLHEMEVPSFYDAGSSFPLPDQDEEHDKNPTIKDVLKVLKEL